MWRSNSLIPLISRRWCLPSESPYKLFSTLYLPKYLPLLEILTIFPDFPNAPNITIGLLLPSTGAKNVSLNCFAFDFSFSKFLLPNGLFKSKV